MIHFSNIRASLKNELRLSENVNGLLKYISACFTFKITYSFVMLFVKFVSKKIQLVLYYV